MSRARFASISSAPALQPEPGRLLGEADIEGRAGEQGYDGEGKMSYKHEKGLSSWPVWSSQPSTVSTPLVNPGEKAELL